MGLKNGLGYSETETFWATLYSWSQVSDVQNNVLLAFARGRRASEIHALDFKSIKWPKKDGQDFLTMSPLVGFMARITKWQNVDQCI